MESSVRLNWLAKDRHQRVVDEIEAEAVTATVDEDLEVDRETGETAVIDPAADLMSDDVVLGVAMIEDAAAEADLTTDEDAALVTTDDAASKNAHTTPAHDSNRNHELVNHTQIDTLCKFFFLVVLDLSLAFFFSFVYTNP